MVDGRSQLLRIDTVECEKNPLENNMPQCFYGFLYEYSKKHIYIPKIQIVIS